MMAPIEFDYVLAQIGWSFREAAEHLGVSLRTVKYWHSGRIAVPATPERLLRLLLRGAVTPEQVRQAAISRPGVAA